MNNAAALSDSPAPSRLHSGELLSERYRVVEVLRQGPAGTLVEAIDEIHSDRPVSHRRVAIQVVDKSVVREPAFASRIGKLQKLSHSTIARLLDVKTDSGTLLLVMESLQGPSLHALLAGNCSRMLHFGVARAALRAVARALNHAHLQGIGHGEVSTSNVVLTQTGEFRMQGFEWQDPRRPIDPAADREAFLALACRLLTDAYESRQPPPGISREQWRALRQQGDVLAAFATDTQFGDAPTGLRRLFL